MSPFPTNALRGSKYISDPPIWQGTRKGDREAGSRDTSARLRLWESGNPDGAWALLGGDNRERSSLSPLSSQAGALTAQGWRLLKRPATVPAKRKWGLRGPQAGSGGPRCPRARAWECGLRGVTGGGAGRLGPEEGRGPGGGKRSGPLAAEALGPRSAASRTPSAPSSQGPRHYGRAVPLPLPGSAALPAPRTPSF